LVANNVYKNRLELTPAYFWLNNLYALERNSWKARFRDRRKIKTQHFETDYLAPDTAEEIITALSLLEGWLGDAGYSSADLAGMYGTQDIKMISCRHLENSKRNQVIKYPLRAIAAYRQMLRWYAVKTIAVFLDMRSDLDYRGLCLLLSGVSQNEASKNEVSKNEASQNPAAGQRVSEWVNMGGQITPACKVDELRKCITAGKYHSWDEIHRVYNEWQEAYPLDKARHAWAVLALTGANPNGSAFLLKQELAAAVETRRWISDQIYHSREKDLNNPFRKMTFRNEAEMEQVLGKVCDNPFINHDCNERKWFEELINRVITRL
jgi:predicted RNA-binding protein YlxR (DUF448 family)